MALLRHRCRPGDTRQGFHPSCPSTDAEQQSRPAAAATPPQRRQRSPDGRPRPRRRRKPGSMAKPASGGGPATAACWGSADCSPGHRKAPGRRRERGRGRAAAPGRMQRQPDHRASSAANRARDASTHPNWEARRQWRARRRATPPGAGPTVGSGAEPANGQIRSPAATSAQPRHRREERGRPLARTDRAAPVPPRP